MTENKKSTTPKRSSAKNKPTKVNSLNSVPKIDEVDKQIIILLNTPKARAELVIATGLTDVKVRTRIKNLKQQGFFY